MALSSYSPFIMLTLAMLSLWLPGQQFAGRQNMLWLVLFSVAMLLALLSGVITPVALFYIGLLLLLLFIYRRVGIKTGAVIFLLISILAVLFATHLLPGFHNPPLLERVVLSEGAIPYSLYLNFDKAVLGLCMLALLHPRISTQQDWQTMLQQLWPVTLLTLLLVIGFALISGYTRFAPKWPDFILSWLWVNLFFTCMVEEMFFRGFMQRELARYLRNYPYGAIIAWLIAGVLFGLAHIAGGLHYVLLASLAGLGYGWAYYRTQRIEACILLHFLLNTVHILFFSYPALAH